jgi:hypothetical protein
VEGNQENKIDQETLSFTPHLSEHESEGQEALTQLLETPIPTLTTNQQSQKS